MRTALLLAAVCLCSAASMAQRRVEPKYRSGRCLVFFDGKRIGRKGVNRVLEKNRGHVFMLNEDSLVNFRRVDVRRSGTRWGDIGWTTRSAFEFRGGGLYFFRLGHGMLVLEGMTPDWFYGGGKIPYIVVGTYTLPNGRKIPLGRVLRRLGFTTLARFLATHEDVSKVLDGTPWDAGETASKTERGVRIPEAPIQPRREKTYRRSAERTQRSIIGEIWRNLHKLDRVPPVPGASEVDRGRRETRGREADRAFEARRLERMLEEARRRVLIHLERFRNERAKAAHDAFGAERLPRPAYPPPVGYEEEGESGPFFRREGVVDDPLYRGGVFGVGGPDPVGEAYHVGVGREPRLPEHMSEEDVGGLPSDAREGYELLHRVGELPPEIRDYLFGRGDDVFGFGSGKSYRTDKGFHFRRIRRRH